MFWHGTNSRLQALGPTVASRRPACDCTHSLNPVSSLDSFLTGPHVLFPPDTPPRVESTPSPAELKTCAFWCITHSAAPSACAAPAPSSLGHCLPTLSCTPRHCLSLPMLCWNEPAFVAPCGLYNGLITNVVNKHAFQVMFSGSTGAAERKQSRAWGRGCFVDNATPRFCRPAAAFKRSNKQKNRAVHRSMPVSTSADQRVVAGASGPGHADEFSW